MLDKTYQAGDVEAKWSEVWRKHRIFTAGVGTDLPSYCIILPPPNITGKLTVGHALGTTVQDVLVRWKRLQGHNTLWLPGTDHAGIATQKVVEQSLESRGTSREELGREKFLEECWRWKEKYHESIVRQLGALGASLDWTREAFTLDPGVSRAVREVFVRLFEQGLIYRERYIVNWCPSCGTAISDEEVEFGERRGKLYYIAYPFVDGGGEIVVGTTRPETMLGDTAVAMSPHDERAEAFNGKVVTLPLTGRKIPIILDEAVDPDFGTGFLKVTPAHDATDFEIGLRRGLDPVVVIDRDGRMNEEAGRFAGLDRDEARERVLEALEEEGLLRKIEDYDHSVGTHDRCSTVIEPYISRQWFLRMETLASPGIEVVENGEIVFYPERWKNIYLGWMRNIRDWCISRQLWWGHRIPVWYCRECNEMIASIDTPTVCPKCHHGKLEQDEDVLDTWFSSWLWTFSPMGWPQRTEDLAMFHPTSVLVTGGDIIFFWVARMIMASLAFMNEVPFSTVYITGIVRDMQGRKMSKSLGNSPDPIDIIESYGSDAFRFTLMMLSPPGQDIFFDEKKVDVGKHFANKIWNAARFVLGQGCPEFTDTDPGDEPIPAAFATLFGARPGGAMELGWEDGWIVSRLVNRMDEFEAGIDAFRFDEAARTVYDFFWHEFCDWYLELAKPALRQEGSRSTGTIVTARLVLGASMLMLHPIMPFISEEIWSMLTPDAPLLAGYRAVKLPGGLISRDLERDVELFREIVTSIRNLRQSFNVPPVQRVNVVINCEGGSGLVDRLRPYCEQVRSLASVELLEAAERVARPKGSAAAGLASMEIYLPLEGILDIDRERERLGKELSRITGEHEKLRLRLADTRFLERAPANVVSKERERFAEMGDRKRHLERILEDLG
ncbi:MAG: valine--tRNA ligase [bacterium]|nr:MAG: valine--tRNA ligase [bacterium]